MTMILILGVTALAQTALLSTVTPRYGAVSNVDIILIARSVVGITDNIDVDTADINGDGEVTNTDLISVARYTVFGRHLREVVLSAGYKVLTEARRGGAVLCGAVRHRGRGCGHRRASMVRVATLYDNGDGDNGDSVRATVSTPATSWRTPLLWVSSDTTPFTTVM